MKNKHILIIDDDSAILESLSFFLDAEGYTVTTKSTFSKPSDISQLSPDLIFLDYWVGEKNGGDICKSLKADEKTKHIPVVLMSANNMLPTLSKTIPADSYIEKPFDLEKIIAIIHAF